MIFRGIHTSVCRLSTLYREDLLCVSCGSKIKSRNHLFMATSFKIVLKKVSSEACKIGCAATIYHLWLRTKGVIVAITI